MSRWNDSKAVLELLDSGSRKAQVEVRRPKQARGVNQVAQARNGPRQQKQIQPEDNGKTGSSIQLSEYAQLVQELVAEREPNQKVVQQVLTAANSAYITAILANYHSDSRRLEDELWREVFSPLLSLYRKRVKAYKGKLGSGALSSSADGSSGPRPGPGSSGETKNDKLMKSFMANYEQLTRLLRLLSKFYRDYIKQLLDTFGGTDLIQSVIPVLKLYDGKPDLKKASESISDDLTNSVKQALCRFGDFSRYRTTMYYLEAKNPDFSHARIYYRSAIAICPTDGTAYNQLGNLEMVSKNYVEALLVFLQSQSVENPFGFDNVTVLTSKLCRHEFNTIASTTNLPGYGRDKDSAAVKKRIVGLTYWFGAFYQLSSEPQPLGDTSGFSSKETKVRMIAQALEKHLLTGKVLPRTLVDVALIGILVNHLTEQKLLSGPQQFHVYARGDSANNEALTLTIALFETVLEAGLELLVMHKKDVFDSLLPCLRVLFDWINKYLASDVDWDAMEAKYRPLMVKITDFVEFLRAQLGFQFDVLTAVKTLSGRRALGALEEEKKCLGLVPFEGALNDTPSGYDVAGAIEQDVSQFRCQCLLFSAIELARLGYTWVSFDETTQKFSYTGPIEHTKPASNNGSDTTVDFNDSKQIDSDTEGLEGIANSDPDDTELTDQSEEDEDEEAESDGSTKDQKFEQDMAEYFGHEATGATDGEAAAQPKAESKPVNIPPAADDDSDEDEVIVFKGRRPVGQ